MDFPIYPSHDCHLPLSRLWGALLELALLISLMLTKPGADVGTRRCGSSRGLWGDLMHRGSELQPQPPLKQLHIPWKTYSWSLSRCLLSLAKDSP